MPAGCEIPMPTRDNMEEYLEQQMREQQYETQQMAEKIRAQFEGELISWLWGTGMAQWLARRTRD